MEYYRIKRSPFGKVVSGLYNDETEAVTKADDLEAARPFTYWVESVERDRRVVEGVA